MSGWGNSDNSGNSNDSSFGNKDMSNLGANLPIQKWNLEELPIFEKNFYYEHPSVQQMTEEEVFQYRKEREITVDGKEVPKPVRSFEEASFPGKKIKKNQKTH